MSTSMPAKKLFRVGNQAAAPSKVESQQRSTERRLPRPQSAGASRRSGGAAVDVSAKNRPISVNAPLGAYAQKQKQRQALDTEQSSLDLVDTDCDEISRDYLKVVSFSDVKGDADVLHRSPFNDTHTTDEDIGANTTNEMSSPEHAAVRGSGRKSHKMVVRSVSSSIMKTQRAGASTTSIRGGGAAADETYYEENNIDQPFLTDIMAQIKHLSGEMRYYEQLAGRRSCFDDDELDRVTDVDETKVSQKQVMTHLVHLVCMNMSHLLKNQIDMQKQNERMGHLAAKMEQLLGPSPPSTQVENLYQHQERSYIESFLGGHGAEQTTAELEVSPVRADGYKKAVNGAIAELLTPPLTPSAGEAVAALSSSIIQSSLMNGSSPSDWLFQDNFSTPVTSQHPCMPNSSSLNVIPNAPVKAAPANRSGSTDDAVLDYHQFAEVTRNLDSKFAAVSPLASARGATPSTTSSLVSPPRLLEHAVSRIEARTGYLYDYALTLLDSPSQGEADSCSSLPASRLPAPAPRSRHPYRG